MSESVGVAAVVGTDAVSVASGDGTDGADAGARVTDALDDAGCEVRTPAPAAAVDTTADAVVVVGERALLDLVAAGVPDAPVLPVAAGEGVRSVPLAAVEAAVTGLVAGDATPVDYPVLSISVDGEHRTRALCDCMLVTAEPAQISEYAVAAGDTAVDQFRADGVVVATPAGSHGYARRLDAPVVDPRVDALAVAPIAPFATHSDHWVFPADSVRLTVERDVVPIDLLADDRTAGQVPPDTPVDVARGGTLSLLTVPESQPPFPERQR